jgi:hypothetical protein
VQNLGEYGALSGISGTLQSAANWVESSLDQDRSVWIGAAVVIVILLFVFRKR